MRINEIFQGFQGEGKTVGQNSVFLRLSGCTLACKYCDTKYHVESKEMSVKEVQEEIMKYNTENVVITGGEPLLQQDEVIQLIDNLIQSGRVFHFTIETNGTIIPKKQLIESVDLFSCSPKLENSGNDLDKRMNYDALTVINNSYNYLFKFVVSNETDIEEIKFLINQIGINDRNVYLMKEGKSREEQLDVEQLLKICKENNFNFSPRLHILIYNQKRGV